MQPTSKAALAAASEELERVLADSSGGSAPSSGGSGGSAASSGGSGGSAASSGGSAASSGGSASSSGGPADSSGDTADRYGGPAASGGSAAASAVPVDSSGGTADSSRGPADSFNGTAGSSGGPAPSSGGPAPSSGGTGVADTTSTELYSVADALAEHLELRRHLIDASVPEESRVGLVDGVFGEKVGEPTLRVLRTLVGSRPSTPTDLLEAVETLGRDATLAVAEQEGSLSDVEDELFRFGRILEAEPRLRALLSDTTASADKRLELLHDVTGDKLNRLSERLLEQVVRRPTTRATDRAAEELAEAAAARRDRSIARVTAPVVLSDAQEDRLAETLSQLYGRSISVQSDVDPELIGGLVVHVGGELIDGSIAGRLRSAQTSLPG